MYTTTTPSAKVSREEEEEQKSLDKFIESKYTYKRRPLPRRLMKKEARVPPSRLPFDSKRASFDQEAGNAGEVVQLTVLNGRRHRRVFCGNGA